MIYINVKSPVGRYVFISRDYTAPSEKPIPVTLTLPAGTYTIETVSNNAVDFRGRVDNVPDGQNVDLDLQPVIPPQPIPGGQP